MTARTPDRIDRIVDGVYIGAFIVAAAAATWMIGDATRSYPIAIIAGMVLAVICASFAHAVITSSADREEPGAVE